MDQSGNSQIPNPRQSSALPGINQSALLYRAAQRHFKNGEWNLALAAVDELLVKYPKAQELHDLRKELQKRIRHKGVQAFRQSPVYRAAVRHVQRGEWLPGQALVERLLQSYPQDRDLLTLQKDISQKVKLAREKRYRRQLFLALSFLSLWFVIVSGIFIQYLRKPAPLAEMIAPNADLNYAPHYLFSIYGTDKPMGIGISPQGDRIYVSEMGGDRLVRIFDSKGKQFGSIELPHTSVGERAPVYLATDSSGQVYVSDRKQHAVFIFNKEGEYVDTLLGPDQTLSEYVQTQVKSKVSGEKYVFNLFENILFYQAPDGTEQSISLPFLPEWAPLGIRIDDKGNLFLTDVDKNKNSIMVISLTGAKEAISGNTFQPSVAEMGTTGQADGELQFPNTAMADSKGRIFVADGNNGRISVWDQQGSFLYNFGKGTGEGSLSLPRGLFIDHRDRLFVVDTVGQNIKVYDVSKTKPVFLYSFGDYGVEDGLFNYPNDIAIDKSGRLYIADRENNRVQVWSY